MDNVVFTATSPLGHQIICTDRNKLHICEHKIMEQNLKAVENTIINPVAIYKSLDNIKRQVFFSKTPATYSPLITKVVVEVNDKDMTGEVVTAFPKKEIGGGIDEEEGLLYVKL